MELKKKIKCKNKEYVNKKFDKKNKLKKKYM